MTQPTPGQIEAATDAMRAESDLWNDIHERLNQCAGQVGDLAITVNFDAVLFAGFVATYNDVAQAFATRCREGAGQAFAVGVALYSVADGYAAVEAGNLRELQGQERGGPR